MNGYDLKRFVPPFVALCVLTLSILLFGSSSVGAGLLVSILALLGTCFVAFVSSEMRMSFNVMMLLIFWVALTVAHFVLGFNVFGHQDYFVLLAAIALYWLGETSVLAGVRPGQAVQYVLVFGLIISFIAVFQYFLAEQGALGITLKSPPSVKSSVWMTNDNAAVLMGALVLISVAHLFRTWVVTQTGSGTRQSLLTGRFLPRSAIGIATLFFAATALILTESQSIIVLTLVLSMFLIMHCMLRVNRSRKNPETLNWMVWALSLIVFGLVVFFVATRQDAASIHGMVDAPEGYMPRSELWAAILKSFQFKPFLGHGLAHFNEALMRVSDPSNNRFFLDQNGAYNFLLQTLLQVGAVGLAAIFFIYFVIIGGLVKALGIESRYRVYIMAVISVSILMVTQGLFSNGFEIPAIVFFHAWLLGFGHGIVLKYG